MVQARMVMEGQREVARQFKEIGGKELRKEYGQVHKRIGDRVIREAGGKQTGVGAGRGASIRSSASTREIQVRVGGAHREMDKAQWGIRQQWPGGEAPDRPYLIGAAVDIRNEIMDMYRDGIAEVAAKAGLKLR